LSKRIKGAWDVFCGRAWAGYGDPLDWAWSGRHEAAISPPKRSADLPCAALPPWSDDEEERCPSCNAKRGEPCGLEAPA
jgi:hypothetical protein